MTTIPTDLALAQTPTENASETMRLRETQTPDTAAEGVCCQQRIVLPSGSTVDVGSEGFLDVFSNPNNGRTLVENFETKVEFIVPNLDKQFFLKDRSDFSSLISKMLSSYQLLLGDEAVVRIQLSVVPASLAAPECVSCLEGLTSAILGTPKQCSCGQTSLRSL